MQELRDFQFNLMYRLKVLYIVIEKPQPQMTFYEQHMATLGRKNFLLIGKNLQQKWAQEGAAVCRDRLGVRRKEESRLR